MTWKIYYADGTTFDNTLGSPTDAPRTGVICVKERDVMHGWVLLSGKDFYLYHDDEWWVADESGFWQYMFSRGRQIVLFGTSVPNEVFHKIMGEAINDPSFGEKSAHSPLEQV